jgi:hypothetical protein
MRSASAWIVASLFLAGSTADAKPATDPMPTVAKAAFVKLMRGTEVIPDKGWVTFKSVKKGNGPVQFTFKSGSKAGSGFATLYKKQWVFSTQKVTAKDLNTVTKAMVSHLKEYFFEGWDESPKQIAKYCKLVRPERTFWTGEMSDPYSLVNNYPMVFACTNPTGSDHGFYVGYNPKTKATEAYDFN